MSIDLELGCSDVRTHVASLCVVADCPRRKTTQAAVVIAGERREVGVCQQHAERLRTSTATG